MTQLNDTQKYAMVQGEGKVSLHHPIMLSARETDDIKLTDNGTGINACIGHIKGNSTLGIPDICMGDGPA